VLEELNGVPIPAGAARYGATMPRFWDTWFAAPMDDLMRARLNEDR
jgi:hypothetical protein